jgi:hypothetical protein
MRNHIDIDSKHSRAIVQQIGERLAAFTKEDPQLPASLRAQIDRLRELEDNRHRSFPVLSSETSFALQHRRLGRRGRHNAIGGTSCLKYFE